MPTVAEWQQALCRPYYLNVESSEQLCADIGIRQQKSKKSRLEVATKRDLAPWPPSGRRESVEVRPIDILHILGRITTPPVTELVDLSSTWAEIRYLWAFHPNLRQSRPISLRLSEPAKSLDFHQKTLLSDEFGVGFAAYYMATFEGATDPVDVFIARRNLQIPIRGNSLRSLPDYIFCGPGQDQYFIVECKGTQSQRSSAIQQLRRGAEQVVTVDIEPPASVTRLVIGSWLQRSISLLIVDPPDNFPEARVLSRWSSKELMACAKAKKLAYIGDYAGAQAALHDIIDDLPSIHYEERELASRQTESGVFRGSEEMRLTPDGRELSMFRGIREESAHAHKESIKSRSAEIIKHPFILESFSDRDIAVIRSISPDGSLFEVRVQ